MLPCLSSAWEKQSSPLGWRSPKPRGPSRILPSIPASTSFPGRGTPSRCLHPWASLETTASEGIRDGGAPQATGHLEKAGLATSTPPPKPAPSQIQPGSFLLLLLVPKLSQHQVMATLSSKATSALERAAEERSKSLTCWTHEEF